MAKAKIPDAVKLAALMLCDCRKGTLPCSSCPIDMGKDCDVESVSFARRILTAWRKSKAARRG